MSSPRAQYLDRLTRRIHRADYDIARGASLEWLQVHVDRFDMELPTLQEHFQDHWIADHIRARIADIQAHVATLLNPNPNPNPRTEP